MTNVALTIAGSDPSGGAGLQADLKTFQAHGVFGTSAVTLLTVQNTQAVSRLELLDVGLIEAQIDAVLDDLPPDAIKTGALGDAPAIRAVARRLASVACPIVIDPVMISKHGHALLDDDAVADCREQLLPIAHVVTPNRFEAARLVGFAVDSLETMHRAAEGLARLGARHVVIKGAAGLGDMAVDVLRTEDGQVYELKAPSIASKSTHGTGCVFAAAVTARLARGEAVVNAVEAAKQFVNEAIRTAPQLGRGQGPVNLMVANRFLA